MAEYLVTMTTRTPEGTPPRVVDAVRSQEAAHTRQLAAEGRVLRLWRPPLKTGEWRTIGLFAAADADELHRTLTSMPLSVWRTDAPLALTPHPNDPGRDQVRPRFGTSEFLVTFVMQVPAQTDSGTVDELLRREETRTRQLAGAGHLIRLWALPDDGRSLGLWQATTADQLREVLASLPLALSGRLTTRTIPLTPHPNDPTSVRHPEMSEGSAAVPTS